MTERRILFRMDITKGFQIDEPDVFIPWDITENGLVGLLEKFGLNKITDGYYCMSCKSLGGLTHMLGFHFQTGGHEERYKDLERYLDSIGTIVKKIGPALHPGNSGKLVELEFFRKAHPDLQESFEEFQMYFEKEFGKPSRSRKGKDGNWCHEWNIAGIEISHYLFYRFGPEERLRIKK